ncbi:MAG: BT4734/BF3469 family protein [Terrimicrobiaceae bacterium]|nr:BT4734/BF3469 family protein [Terrimicrobiaceae bacterium]
MKNITDAFSGSNAEDFWMKDVAFFPKMKARHPSTQTLGSILDQIRNGRWEAEIERLREIRRRFDRTTYDKQKETLPSFYASGSAQDPKTMLTHSGAIQVDLDNLGTDLLRFRRALEAEPSIGAIFLSPGGEGLKLIVRIDPLANPVDADEHKTATKAAQSYLRKRYGVDPDPSCVNINRHCLISHDPNLFRRSEPVPFEWRSHKEDAEEKKMKSSSSRTSILQDSLVETLHESSTTPHPSKPLRRERLLKALRFHQQVAESQPLRLVWYQRLVERRRDARIHERNSRIVESIPLLFHALSEDAILLYMEWFYRFNEHLFEASLEQHMKEAKSMLRNVGASYPGMLSEHEREVYSVLNECNRAAFRICRDLAFRSAEGELPPPAFFLSHGSLAERLNRFKASGEPQSEYGGRALRLLTNYEIIRVTTVGKRRERGVLPEATRYEWLLAAPDANGVELNRV